MRNIILPGLLAIIPIACHAIDLPKPFTLTFYLDGKGDKEFHDETNYPEGVTADKGISPDQDNSTYLDHYKFSSIESSERSFTYRPSSLIVRPDDLDNCTVVLSGDPKVDSLVYLLDSQRYIEKGDNEPDFSVIHIRCQAPLAKSDEPIVDIAFADTDFEAPLVLEFYISDVDSTDDLFNAIGVAKPSEDEKTLESFHFKDANQAESDLAKYHREDQYTVGKIDYSISYNARTKVKVVGKFVFLRFRPEPRKFSWALHKTPESKSRQCYVNVNADPHVAYVQINLDGDEPEIDWKDRAETRAITVTCEDAVE